MRNIKRRLNAVEKKLKKKSVKRRAAKKHTGTNKVTTPSLTIRQKRACDIYHSMEKPNKRLAYEMAGYRSRGRTAEVEAQRMMDLPYVKAYLDSLKIVATEKAQKTASEIIAELEKVGFNAGWGEKAKVRSLELLGRRYGLFPTREVISPDQGELKPFKVVLTDD